MALSCTACRARAMVDSVSPLWGSNNSLLASAILGLTPQANYDIAAPRLWNSAL